MFMVPTRTYCFNLLCIACYFHHTAGNRSVPNKFVAKKGEICSQFRFLHNGIQNICFKQNVG